MVAGSSKVKQAMGLQKSPSPASTPKPEHFPSPSSTNTKTPSSNHHQKPVFSRSFGVYFPRSSAQVQPRPPDVTELLRIVEELKDRESQLKTKLVEQKLLKESAAIVPFLENEINSKNAEIDSSAKRIESLEADNERLRDEMESLMVRIEEQRRDSGKKIKELELEIFELKKKKSLSTTNESKKLMMISTTAAGGIESSDECSSSSSQRFLGLMDASAKSNLLRNLKRVRSMDTCLNQENHKVVEVTDLKKEEVESGYLIPEISEIPIVKLKGPRVPKPPPTLSTPSTSSSSSSSSCSSSSSTSSTSESMEIPMPMNKASSSSAGGISDLTTLPPIPPPPPPPLPRAKTTPIPPPPPSPAARGAKSTVAKVKRVPEVVEFYHSLMRRDSRKESGVGVSDVQSAANTRDMIGEIENRSAHLIAIKTDVETQGDFIRFLIKEVENAAFTNIEDVVAFVKWLDDELSYLVDERAVLKHFEWPETKADALREAAFGYCDLKKLESEASTFCEDIRQSNGGGPVLKKMQALLEKLEHGVYNLSRMRESATKKYKGFCIPTEWMSETGFVSQIKLVSVKLAMKYMKRVSAELEAVGSAPEVEELMLQGVRFAFRVHQFAGGFDMETMRAFQELKNKARSCHVQIQNHQQQKLICRSTPC